MKHDKAYIDAFDKLIGEEPTRIVLVPEIDEKHNENNYATLMEGKPLRYD